MSFVERHIYVLAAAVAGMIVLRIFDYTNFQAIGASFQDRGFFQMPGLVKVMSNADGNLAMLITQALQRKRSGNFENPNMIGDETLITGSTAAPPSENKEEKKTSAEAAKSEKDTQKPTPPVLPNAEQDSAERSLLEKLGLRRSELDKREEELASREALLQAAEKRLTERNAELKALEEELKASAEAQKAEKQALKPVIVMYEAMKPKDAARLFEKLDPLVLMPLAAAMNPRKLADILAQTDPVLASAVTKNISGLTQEARAKQMRSKSDPANELPDYIAQGSP